MPNQLSVNIAATNKELTRSLAAILAETPDVLASISAPADSFQERSDIIILEAEQDPERLFAKLAWLKKEKPESLLFVISENTNPDYIIRVMKSGASEYFMPPIAREDLRRAIESNRGRFVQSRKSATGSTYSFLSAKGGLGATVLAVNTAAAMAAKRRQVALCDIGLASGDGSVLLDVTPMATIGDLSRNIAKLDDSLVKNAFHKHSCGLEFLAAPRDPEEAELVQAGHVDRILELAAGQYDPVLVDCTSMLLGGANIEACGRSEKIFIVLDLSVPAIRNGVRIEKHLRKIGIPSSRIEFLINRYTKYSPLPVKEADRSLGKPAFWIFPNAYEEVFSSVSSGIPLACSHPRSPFGKSVSAFAEILQNPGQRNGFRGISGLLGRAI